jgi:PAS domain S-box-containing protein
MVSNETHEELKHKIAKLEKELSDLRYAEQSLKKERDFISEVLHWTESLVVVIDLNGYIVKFNRSSEKLSGYCFEEVKDKPFWDILLAAEEKEGVKSAITDVIKRGLPDTFQNSWVTKDGSKRLISWVNSILRKPDGSIEHILCTGRDITEQKKADEALRDSEEKYRELVQHANSIILRFDIQGRITFFNEFAQSFFGYTEKEILHQNIIGTILPETESSGRDLKAMFEDMVRNPLRYVHNENENIKRSDERVWIAWTNKAILGHDGNLSEILSVGMDITDRRRATQALTESEATLKSIFRAAPTGIGMVANRMLGRVNERLCEMVGYSSDELVGQSARIIYPSEEEFKGVGEEKYAQIRERGTGTVETRWQRKDGSIIDVLLSSTPIDSADPSGGVTFTALDITDRKRAEEALRVSEEKFSKAFQASPVWVSITTVNEGRFLEVNDTFSKISGFTREEAIGRTSFDLGFWLDPAKDRDRALQIFRKQGYFRNLEMKMRFKDGKVHIMLWSADPIEFEGQECFINVLTNITEQKMMEAEKAALESRLQQAQKMEAIGTLAGGIAHDFNNILSAVIGYTELALNDVEKETALYHNLQEIFRAGGRAKDLVKQILAFSRQAEQDRKPVQVKLIAKEAVKFLRASLPTTIKIHQDLQSGSLVNADPIQIHQVIINLCTNAGHAMLKKGGVLEVKLADVQLETDFMAEHPELKPGAYLELTVSDSGHGMPAHILDRIFDPFFTTKEKGEGTGMGLAVVHGIAGSHGGTVTASSEPNKGSTFKVYLPAVERQLETQVQTDEPIATGTERILFVDDEPALTNIGKQILESLGYEVTARTSSIEALELFKAKPNGFDLVITDMTMPNLAGDELAKEMIHIRPETPVILCTGYSARINQQQAKAMGIRAFISKPVLKRDIAETTRKVLDGKLN